MLMLPATIVLSTPSTLTLIVELSQEIVTGTVAPDEAGTLGSRLLKLMLVAVMGGLQLDGSVIFRAFLNLLEIFSIALSPDCLNSIND